MKMEQCSEFESDQFSITKLCVVPNWKNEITIYEEGERIPQ
jgi:hypothetical protein